MAFNTNQKDKNSYGKLASRVAGGRYSLLLVLIFTLVNLVMVLLDTDRYFLFSASVPYYMTFYGKAMDNGFTTGAWDVNGTYTMTALVVSAVILALYFLCWFLSRKKPGWMAGALALFTLDTVALLLISYVLYGNILINLVDLLIHIWVLWELFQAVKSHKKLQTLPPEEPVTPTRYNAPPEF